MELSGELVTGALLVVDHTESEDDGVGGLQGLHDLEGAGLEELPDALQDVVETEPLPAEEGGVDLNSEDPGGVESGLFSVLVEPDHITVFLNDGGSRIGVVVDLGNPRNVFEGGELEEGDQLVGVFDLELELLLEVDGHGRSLDVFGAVNDLLDPGHTEGDILGGNSREMEGVKGHLSQSLSDGLGGDGADHLTRVHQRGHVAVLDLIEEVAKGLGR